MGFGEVSGKTVSPVEQGRGTSLGLFLNRLFPNHALNPVVELGDSFPRERLRENRRQEQVLRGHGRCRLPKVRLGGREGTAFVAFALAPEACPLTVSPVPHAVCKRRGRVRELVQSPLSRAVRS